jgi:hypothetical protein
MYKGGDAFLTSASIGNESSAARFYRFTPQGKKQPCSRTDLYEVETKRKSLKRIPHSGFHPSIRLIHANSYF